MERVRVGPVRLVIAEWDDTKFRRYVKRFTDEKLPHEVKQHFNRVGIRAANAYRREVPVGPTGNLQRSVRYKVYAKRANGDIGIVVGPWGRKASHRHLVEYGHRNRAGQVVGAHPYAGAAGREALQRLESGLPDAVQQAIQSAEG